MSPISAYPNSSAYLVYLAYFICGVLIILYAWDRFNTPASNRSSTRQALYRWGCVGYVVSALGLFAVLSILLEFGPWRTMLLGPVDKLSLPAPFIATLAMTTLLSSVPLLKRIDGWFLSTFLDWAAIPAEVKRRAATMTPHNFRVTEEEAKTLRDACSNGSYGSTLAKHLCARCNDGMESQYCLTKILRLYDRIKNLEGRSGYTRFFSGVADEFAALERKVTIFLRRSDISLTLAKRLRKVRGQNARAYQDLMEERRNTFAEDCRNLFGELALFLARAVLRSEPSEKDIVDRLSEIGFFGSASEPMNLPRFPIDSLTLLAGAMLLYFWIVLQLPIVPHHDDWLFIASKVTIARLASIGLTVWLMQKNYSVFHRLPGGPPRYFGYVLCGVLAAAASAGVCLIFSSGLPIKADLPIIVLSGVLCAALSFCCDDWTKDTVAPTWLRFVEAIGCGLLVAAAMALLYFGTDLLPTGISRWVLVLPSVLALIVGVWVPHIYRSAHLAAMSERGNAPELPVSQAVAEETVVARDPVELGTDEPSLVLVPSIASVPRSPAPSLHMRRATPRKRAA
jgi:hypothetical protein